jgi:hypothetical protein
VDNFDGKNVAANNFSILSCSEHLNAIYCNQRNRISLTRALYSPEYKSYKHIKKCNATYYTPCNMSNQCCLTKCLNYVRLVTIDFISHVVYVYHQTDQWNWAVMPNLTLSTTTHVSPSPCLLAELFCSCYYIDCLQILFWDLYAILLHNGKWTSFCTNALEQWLKSIFNHIFNWKIDCKCSHRNSQ